jgi:hypothetical protein
METTLMILSILCVLYAGYCTVKFFKWRKQANAEHFYNKQGQECTKQEMEAELRPHKYPKKWPIEIPEEEAFD